MTSSLPILQIGLPIIDIASTKVSKRVVLINITLTVVLGPRFDMLLTVLSGINVRFALLALRFKLRRLKLVILALSLILLELEASAILTVLRSVEGLQLAWASITYHHRLLLGDEVFLEEKLLIISLIFLYDIIQIHLITLMDG